MREYFIKTEVKPLLKTANALKRFCCSTCIFFYVVIRAATKLLYSGSCIFFRESSTTWYYSFNEIFSHLQFDKDDEVLYSASYIYEAHRLPIGKHLSKQSI